MFRKPPGEVAALFADEAATTRGTALIAGFAKLAVLSSRQSRPTVLPAEYKNRIDVKVNATSTTLTNLLDQYAGIPISIRRFSHVPRTTVVANAYNFEDTSLAWRLFGNKHPRTAHGYFLPQQFGAAALEFGLEIAKTPDSLAPIARIRVVGEDGIPLVRLAVGEPTAIAVR